MRAVAGIWRQYQIRVKDAWRNQANNSNELPVYGRFDHVPQYLMEWNRGLDNNVINSLYNDWTYVYTRIQNSICDSNI